MTPKEKAIEMMMWFDTYYIDEEKNIAFTFTHLTLEEKKYILTKSIDDILSSEPTQAHFIKGWLMTPKTYWNEVKQEIENL